MNWKVSEVARAAHVTVRTLHHYDEIGLLVPSERSSRGYRLYTEADLQRLHQILLMRELGFQLEAIPHLLDAPLAERQAALRAQRALLESEVRKTEATIRAVDAALEALEKGGIMDKDKLFEGFENFDNTKYEAEARERWGDTKAFKESMRRTKSYTKQDWDRIKNEAADVVIGFTRLLQAGESPESAAAMNLAEAHRAHISRWFYECSYEIHTGLADMYVADPRFTEYYDKHAAGLAAFVKAAIIANAERAKERTNG